MAEDWQKVKPESDPGAHDGGRIEKPKRKKKKLSPDEIKNYSTTREDDAAKKKEDALKKITDPVDIMNNLRRSGKDARSAHKSMWDNNWNLYDNNYDFTLKASWQSKNFVPTVPNLVRGIAYAVKQSMVNAGDFFTVDFPAIPKDSPFKNEVNNWGIQILRHEFKKNKFPSLISEAVRLSLLESLMIIKCLPDGNKGNVITCDSAYNVMLDPTGRNRFKLHSIATDLDLVIERAEAGIYDKAEVDKAVEDFTRQPEATDEANRKVQQYQPTTDPPYRKQCVIDEFYGDLIGGDGKIIMKACSYSVLNEKYLIRKQFEIKSVLDHGQCPLLVGAINPKPKSVYHQAIISDVAGLANIATEILNLTIDSNLMSMANAFELDIDQLADPDDLQGGIFPGKVYKKKVGKPGMGKLLTEIPISGPNQQDLLMYQSIKNEAQQGVGFYNEFAQGSLGMRPGGRATAKEVGEKSAATSGNMKLMSEEIEEQIIVPLLEQMWSNLLQYFSDYEQFDGILPRPLIDFLTEKGQGGLKAIFGDAAKFEAKGMSGVVGRQEELQKFSVFTGMIKQFPQLYPALKPAFILKNIITNFGWSCSQWLQSDEVLSMLFPDGPPKPPAPNPNQPPVPQPAPAQ